MSNKLLTGVLTLAMTAMVSATVFAIPSGKQLRTPPTENPNAMLYGQDDAQSRFPTDLQRNISLPAAPAGTVVGQHALPTFVCVDEDATDYGNGFLLLGSFFDTGANVGVPVLNYGVMVPVQPGFLCSLDGVWHHIFDAGADDISVRFEVWTGSGGVPGVLVAQQDIPLSTLNVSSRDGTGWNFIDWSSFGLYFTDDYFVTAGPTPGSGAGADAWYDILVDNASGTTTNPRTGVTYWGDLAQWLPNNQRWTINSQAVMSGVSCCEEIPFTDCRELDDDIDSYSWIFGLPSTISCRQGFGMRFTSGGYDTLVSTDYYFSDFFSGPLAGTGAAMLIEVLGDDGAGVPDPTNVLFSTTIGGPGLENAELQPLGSFGFATVPMGIVIPPGTSYHVTTRIAGPQAPGAGTWPGMGADDFSTGEGSPLNLASVFFPGTYGTLDVTTPCDPAPLDGWYNYFGVFGINPDFLLIPYVCRDEFIDCELVQNYTSLFFIVPWGVTEGIAGFAGSYQAGGDECRIEQATAYFFDYNLIDSIRVSIYDDAGGTPGSELWGETFGSGVFPSPPTADAYCGPDPFNGTWTLTTFPNGGAGISVSGAYWVVAQHWYDYTIADLCVSYIFHRHDDATGDVRSIYMLDDGAGVAGGAGWLPISAVFGSGFANLNHATNNFRCCVPFNEMVCVPGEDWPTYQHDYARTGHSNNALGEANCNLTTIWAVTADAGTNFGGSVIFGDKILIGDDAGYDCRLTADGSPVWDQNTDVTVSGLFGGATGNRTQATVADIGGTLTAFLGNGLNRDVVAVDANTGAYLWHNTTNAPFPGLHPNTNNLKSVVVNDGAIDVLYYAAQTKVYAVDAATGAPYAGWPAAGAGNPFVMGADNINAVSTDGTNLFVPTFSGAIAGNIYALDLATGALVWDLATVLGDANLWASINGNANYINDEGFFSGASYDDANNSIWANSYFTSDFPGEGYLYHLDAVSGAPMNDPQGSVRSRRATPVIDQNKIYVPVFTRWAGPVYNGFGVYSRSTGFLLGGQDGKIAGDRQYNDGVLTCETGADDWFILGTELGELNFFRMGNADQWVFSRKTTLSGFNGGQWNGGSMGVDIVAFSNLGGITVALAPGADRPRLDILNDPIEEPVEFGSPDPINVVFPDAFTNLGCADLLIDSITFDDGSPSAPTGEKIELTTVDPALLAKMNEYAQYTTNSERFMKVGLMFGEQSAGAGPEYRYAKPVNSSLNYRAAAAFPAVVNGTVGENGLVSPLSGSLIPPGDIVDITVAIKGPLVTRGPHPFLASLYTNDLDYFMDDPTQIPTITLTPVGGCLEDSVRIFFGAASENSTTVYNNGNLARFTGNGANDIDINGFVEGATDFCGGTLTELFGGLRGFSLTPRRMAMTGQSWDGDDYETLLGDPNYCTNTCAAGLQENVLLTEISLDGGVSYTPVMGNLGAVSYVDSAQDFSDGGGGWNTTSFPNIFEPDSTIGISVNETHYGALSAELGDFRLIRMDVTNRSATDSIVGLAAWSHHDDDISANNGANSLQGRPSKGYLYDGVLGCSVVHGYVKVPFGCGVDDYSHVINGTACAQPLSWWSWEAANWWDTMYLRSHLLFGGDSIYYQANMNTFAGEPGDGSDASSDFYFGAFDLGPGETKSQGVAQFAFTDIAAPEDFNQFIGFADLVNKYAGFGRGDVNNDQSIDLADVIYLAGSVAGGNGPYPFQHLGNVDGLGDPNIADAADVAYLVDYYFNCGPCPIGDWALGLCTTP